MLMRSALISLLAIEVAACGAEVDIDTDPIETDSGGFAEPAGYDVIVVGAGAGGIAAAIQAARMGRSVAVLEESGHVGGQLLTVTSMDELGPEREEGIYAEFRQRLVEHYDRDYNHKPVNTCYEKDSSACFEAADVETSLRKWLQDEGVYLETGVRVQGVIEGRPHEIIGITTADGREWPSRILIDGTEYGDLLPLAGADYRVGNSTVVIDDTGTPSADVVAPCVQESTYTLTMKRYDSLPPELDLTGEQIPPGPDYFSRRLFWAQYLLPNQPPPDDTPSPWAGHNEYRGTPDRDNPDNYIWSDYRHTKTMINSLNDYPTMYSLPDLGLPIAAVEDPAQRRIHECAARMRTTQFLYFAQAELQQPWGASDEMSDWGLNLDHCEEFGPVTLGTEKLFPVRPYVREARRMIGVVTLTGTDTRRDRPSTFKIPFHMAHRSWATALSMAYYGTDFHGCYGAATLEAELGDTPATMSGYGPFQIPFGSFIPAEVDGLLAVEKNLSMSRIVNASVRVQPSSMNNGMAAGAIAALAVQEGILARDVPPVLVQDALMASRVPNNISLYTFDDVPRTSPRWPDVQFSSTVGVLVGTGNFQFGADQPLTRAQGAVAMQRTFRYAIDPPSPVTYEDVPATHPMWTFIQAMTREGLTAGCGTSPSGQPLFCPDNGTLRRELAVWITTALSLPHPPCSVRPYPDVPRTDPYCPFIAAVKNAGLGVPCDIGASNFCPAQAVTRADTTAFSRKAIVYMASNPTAAGACYRDAPDYCGEL
jgi:ribulose 1,5-bisphosphate synthetase/thiazole synthase